MLKNISRFECKVGERVYQLLCDMDSPVNEVKLALCYFIKCLGQIEDNTVNKIEYVENNPGDSDGIRE